MPEAIDWARLAAYIDGEGYIRVATGKTHSGRLEVNVSNTDYRLLEWLKSTFGGNVYVGSRKGPAQKKLLWRWVVDRSNAERILAGCLPYFIVKREQAECGLSFQRIISTQNANGEPKKGHKISLIARAERDAITSKLHEARSIGTMRVAS